MKGEKPVKIPADAAFLLEKLNQKGYEAYVVGGCVRDALLGRTPQDWDLCTSALPEETAAIFSDHKLVLDGLVHGTVGVVRNGVLYEITTFRTESGYADARHPDEVRFVRRIEEDLARRDFTVNAMAYHPEKGLVDCFGGKDDLQKGILRCVGDPDTRFHEDALRILRAIRFAAVYGFSLEEETARAALQLCPQLSRISAERIGAELTRFLCGADTSRMIADFWPILSVILPEIGEENWNAVSERMKATEPRLILRLAVLLYPAKEDAQRLLWRLRVAKNTAQQVLSLLQRQDPALPEKAALRLILGQLGEDLTRLRLQLDKALTGDETSFLRQTELLNEILRNGDCCSLSQLAVSGKDLQKLGFWGPQIGQVLQTLLLAVVREEAKNEKTVLLSLAERER